MSLDSRERLIVALDLPSVAAADAMVTQLGASVRFYKIGYQLAFAGGLPFAAKLIAAGKKVFLDLKLHDIGNTVDQGGGERRAARRDVCHRARLSADHEGGGRRQAWVQAAHPGGYRAHVIRRY